MKEIVVVTDNLKKIFASSSALDVENSIKHRRKYILEENLIRELASAPNINLTIITEKGSRVLLNNVNVIEVKYGAEQKYYLPEVNRILRDRKYDGVISFNINGILGNPLLFDHSIEYQRDNEFFGLRFFRNVFQSFLKKSQNETFATASKKTKYFVLSEKMKEDYRKTFSLNPGNIIVIPPVCKKILDAPLVSRGDKLSFGLELAEGLTTSDMVVLTAFWLVKSAGCDFDLKIVLPKNGLHFVYKALIGLFGLKKHIQLFADNDNIIDFYSRINVLLLFSPNEASGLKAMEAMGLGIPCCIWEKSGAAETVNRRNGFVFDDISIKGMAEGLQKVIKLYSNKFLLFKKVSGYAFADVQTCSWRDFALKIVNKL